LKIFTNISGRFKRTVKGKIGKNSTKDWEGNCGIVEPTKEVSYFRSLQ